MGRGSIPPGFEPRPLLSFLIVAAQRVNLRDPALYYRYKAESRQWSEIKLRKK